MRCFLTFSLLGTVVVAFSLLLFAGGQAILGLTSIRHKQCPVLACCEQDCCGKGTSWDIKTDYCVANSTSEGFNGTHLAVWEPGCLTHICCEQDCCGKGLEYNMTIGLFLPPVFRYKALQVYQKVKGACHGNCMSFATTEAKSVLVGSRKVNFLIGHKYCLLNFVLMGKLSPLHVLMISDMMHLMNTLVGGGGGGGHKLSESSGSHILLWTA